MTKLGIKGFGRVGKAIFRHLMESPEKWDMDIAAISEWNSLGIPNEKYIETLIGLIEKDSLYRKPEFKVDNIKKIEEDHFTFTVSGKEFPIYLNRKEVN